jgi:glycerophosphoryl diester phosphodiesterase
MRAALAVPACDGLEFDVRFSKDAVPILLHDATLERVHGVPQLASDLTAEELGAFGIPTLAEVLAAAGDAPFLDIELKEPPTAAFVHVVEEARGSGTGGLRRAVISSFRPEILAAIAALRPSRHWPRWGNTLDLAPATIALAIELGCTGLSTTWRAVDPAGVARAQAAGLDVAAWTVRRRPTFDRLERLGVVAICVEAAALDG